VSGRVDLLLFGMLALLCADRIAGAQDDDDEDERELLQEQLTEREDKRRPIEPLSTKIGEALLTVGGEYELEILGIEREILDSGVEQPDRVLLEQSLEIEGFITIGEPLSLFVQFQGVMEEDLLEDTVDGLSDLFLEREEMWLYSENILGTHLSFEVGRLDFEDDRRWWWDDELDAVRVTYERQDYEIAIAVARELGPNRTDQDYVDPEQERLLRVIAEASWDWRENHSLQLFLVYQDDHSPTETPDQIVKVAREDDEDAELIWLGARATGVFQLAPRGLLGYWLDVAGVGGDEKLIAYDDLTPDTAIVDEVESHDVLAWALDTGLMYVFPLPLEPRIFAGFAFGSGDAKRDSRTDRSFQQTNIQANEAGFGGYERFEQYGFLLDPELSNLGIVTIGAGITLFRSSSLDLVYHHYRLAEPSDELRDARLEGELDDRDRTIGNAIDLVLVLEEWERLEFEVIASAFRAGDAFADRPGDWSFGGFFAVRFAF
jgi:alginate production protein